MAGIGFSLRRLTRRDDLIGVVLAYGHAAFSSTGPWLATVLALGTVSIVGQHLTDFDTLESFRLVVIYNFALSLLAAGPVMMVTTRQIADLVFAKRVEECSSLFLGAVVVLMCLDVPLALGVYVYYAKFDPYLTAIACINFFLVSGVWLTSVFLSTLKAYTRVTLSFAVGLAFGSGAALLLAPDFGAAGLMAGFSGGIAITLFVLIGEIHAEYPPAKGSPWLIFSAFRRYWVLGLSGFVYNLALWSDKLVMWAVAPERSLHPSGLVSYPDYDAAMFIAYLTIVPGMSLFLVIVETGFFEQYHRFYQDMLNHGTLATIRENQRRLVATLNGGLRNMVVLQGSLTVLFVFGAVKLFEVLGIDFTQLAMFRFGTIGSFFQCMLMFMMVTLAYFDLQRLTLVLQALLAGANIGFTYLTVELGYPYYGYGFLAASILVFCLSYLALANFMRRLPYHAFVGHNSAIE